VGDRKLIIISMTVGSINVLFCSSAVLDPRVGQTREVELSGFVTTRGIFGEKCKNHLIYTTWVC